MTLQSAPALFVLQCHLNQYINNNNNNSDTGLLRSIMAVKIERST